MVAQYCRTQLSEDTLGRCLEGCQSLQACAVRECPLPTADAQLRQVSISAWDEAGSREGAGSREAAAAAGAESCQQNMKRVLSEVLAAQTQSPATLQLQGGDRHAVVLRLPAEGRSCCRASAGPAHVSPGSFCQLPSSFCPLRFLSGGDEGKPGQQAVTWCGAQAAVSAPETSCLSDPGV